MKKMYPLILMLIATNAFAQEAAEPPVALPSAPAAEASQNYAPPMVQNTPATTNVPGGYFPALPPSRPCESADMNNAMWKLSQVYEAPPGLAINDFAASPTQYMYFNSDSTYVNYKSADLNTQNIWRKMYQQAPTTLDQFVLQADSGFLFFYRDGAVSGTQACFVVVNARSPYMVGQMLLMPPADQANGERLVKVYTRENMRRQRNVQNRRKRK